MALQKAYYQEVMTRTTTIYFDEHIHHGLLGSFKLMGFRCVHIGGGKKYQARDERDFISEMASEEAIFVTADKEFVEDVIEQGIRHAGIVFVPTGWEDRTLEFAAAGMAGILRGAIEADGRKHLHNQIYAINDDGYYLIEKGKARLLSSTTKIELLLDEQLARRHR